MAIHRVAGRLFLLVWLCAGLVGCQEQQQSNVLAFISSDASDFWTLVRNGCQKAEKELNGQYTVEFRLTAGSSPAEQKRIFDDLLARGVSGIAVSPIDPENATRWINGGAAKTLVVTCESDAPNSNRAFYIGTNNKSAGIMAGQTIREHLPEGAKVVVICDTLNNVRTQQRLEGVKAALGSRNIEIVDIRTDDADRLRAIANAENAIINHPDLAGMIGLASYSGPAIYTAVKAADKKGDIKIVCFDEEPLTLQGIKSKGIIATVVQQPFMFGYEAVLRMVRHLDGDKHAIPPSKKVTFPAKVIGIQEVWDYEILHR